MIALHTYRKLVSGCVLVDLECSGKLTSRNGLLYKSMLDKLLWAVIFLIPDLFLRMVGEWVSRQMKLIIQVAPAHITYSVNIYILQRPMGYACCLDRKKENAATKPAKLSVCCCCQTKLAVTCLAPLETWMLWASGGDVFSHSSCCTID